MKRNPERKRTERNEMEMETYPVVDNRIVACVGVGDEHELRTCAGVGAGAADDQITGVDVNHIGEVDSACTRART